MSYDFVTVRHIGATGVVSIDNPPVNALHPDVAVEIEHAARAIEKDLDLRSMILIGTGRCFVAGGDIRYFTEIDREGAAAMALRVQRMQQALFDLRVPVIAAINGHALGGGLELLLSCDIAIAEEQARIGVTEVQLGLIPGAGGTQMLFSALPVGTAKRLLFTGDRLPAGEAHAIGLVDQVCPPGGSLEAALAIAERINRAGPLAVEAAKRSANYRLRHSLDEGHRREVEIFAALFDTEDHREGITAFLEGRAPHYRRR
ncbi:enoyl-CoA hydratase/carnithine racemase [Frankia torreyi]|uniref:Enoyl-CoA hydratase/carnithine racemase n=2 Tax=Frankia TaxID=1854 RepID=A0A0D8BCR8_9ACTN|nr:enoyl-CoA hydratase/isomerase family protein [Frankia torreyi]KJE21734.1 enoyl-CoA hydratase/carnithine racemase [Frankia torreyi]KQC36543.1 enoyl-CoA hydratase [Frankia sp. ACN1ag]